MRKSLFIICLLFSQLLIAQTYEQDILRFSSNNFSGTSRYVALGGAFSSVGADFSNLSHNPAGIGMYRSSVAIFSPVIVAPQISSSYLENEMNNDDIRLTAGSAGLIFSTTDLKNSKSGLIKNAALGIGLNRMGDYNRKETFEGFNTSNSITHNWVGEVIAQNDTLDIGVDFDQFSFEATNAYWTYLVNYDSTLLTYTSPINNSINQTRIKTSTGGKNEFVISAGANYLDKVYFGATIGVPFINYESTTRFKEEDTENLNADFRNFELVQNYSTTGLGFNFKAGLIYKPHQVIRLSAAFHSPERLSMTENYSSTLNSEFDTIAYTYESPQGEFDYVIRLPWRANTGVSLFLKKHGFISFDYELVDYSSMRYSFADEYADLETSENDLLKSKYKMAHNFRVGIEGVIKKFKIRGGYAYQASPFKDNYTLDDATFESHHISGGFGFIINRFSFDAAYRHSLSKEYEIPYTNATPVVKDVTTPMVSFTIGYKLN